MGTPGGACVEGHADVRACIIVTERFRGEGGTCHASPVTCSVSAGGASPVGRIFRLEGTVPTR
jgi:hypothetical protein